MELVPLLQPLDNPGDLAGVLIHFIAIADIEGDDLMVRLGLPLLIV